MALRITVSFQGKDTIHELNADKVLIGRSDGTGGPSLDLSPDSCVSRHHAKLDVKNGSCWLTDLGSRFGTQVNGA